MTYIPQTRFAGKDPFRAGRVSSKVYKIVKSGRAASGEYSSTFAKLMPGDSIQCDPDRTGNISRCLRAFLERKGKDLKIVIDTKFVFDGMGIIWLLPK